MVDGRSNAERKKKGEYQRSSYDIHIQVDTFYHHVVMLLVACQIMFFALIGLHYHSSADSLLSTL
jgi:hypothetical protein